MLGTVSFGQLGVAAPHYRTVSTSVYETTVTDDGLETMSPTTDEVFNPVEYSRFKYGFYPQAEHYGSLIADALIHFFTKGMGISRSEPIVLVGTPYKSVPNAAKLLVGSAARILRQHGYPVSVGRIYQPTLASGDYGTLSEHERAVRNDHKVRFFERREFTGKHVVLVDDIQITGSIIQSVTSLLNELDLRSLTVITLVRTHYALSQVRNTRVEDMLNHTSIKTLNDLVPLMASRESFVLIARTVKRILEAGEPELRAFLAQLDMARIMELYHAAEDEGYADIESYERSFRVLTEFYPY